MKIFGVGPNKSGTTSLTVAMRRLGFSALHHDPTSRAIIRALQAGTDRPVLRHLENHDALFDGPLYDAIPQLFARYPDCKFIWHTRDREEWVRSRVIHCFHNRVCELSPWRDIDTRSWERDYDRTQEKIANTLPPGAPVLKIDITREPCWDRLCEFLDVPVPDEPFPCENAGVDRLEAILGVYRRSQ